MTKPSITARDVKTLFGDLTDQQVIDILESGATQADLEQAAAYAALADDVMGDLRKPLTGLPAQVYEIVIRDEEHEDEEHAP